MPLDNSGIGLESPFREEYYEIEITGMKDVYFVGEQYDFSHIISGYGYSCGSKEVTFPDQNGDTMKTISGSSCIAGVPMKEFLIDSQKEYGTTSVHGKIKNPGTYTVTVSFDRPIQNFPTTVSKEFHVVEKICNDSDPKDKAQCFSDAFDSCTSAFVELAIPNGEGDEFLITGVVESWHDCSLRVYTNITENRQQRHSETRSICDGMSINDESIIFENCNNANLPPIRFDKQHYLYKEKCEIYGGYWNFEYNTCFDFSEEYDCEYVGGKLVSRAYTGVQPDYSKKSDSFACEFRK